MWMIAMVLVDRHRRLIILLREERSAGEPFLPYARATSTVASMSVD